VNDRNNRRGTREFGPHIDNKKAKEKTVPGYGVPTHETPTRGHYNQVHHFSGTARVSRAALGMSDPGTSKICGNLRTGRARSQVLGSGLENLLLFGSVESLKARE
jgi:hypothetical protein